MILVVGGLGFIGPHVVRGLLELGEECLVTRLHTSRIPAFLPADLPVERVDVTDRAAVLALAERYDLTGIVHLGGVPPAPDDLIGALRANDGALLNILELAQLAKVRRVSVASAIGVYAGVTEVPWREDAPLPPSSPHPIPAAKKVGEILATLIGQRGGFEVANLRIGAIWGPLGRPASPFFAVPELVHAAAASTPFDAKWHAEDHLDILYAPDCGRAVALVQTTPTLRHDTYNIGSGGTVSNTDAAAALARAAPGVELPLRAGRSAFGGLPGQYMDVTRLHQDTGFAPAYGLDEAVADYLGWLRAGNAR